MNSLMTSGGAAAGGSTGVGDGVAMTGSGGNQNAQAGASGDDTSGVGGSGATGSVSGSASASDNAALGGATGDLSGGAAGDSAQGGSAGMAVMAAGGNPGAAGALEAQDAGQAGEETSDAGSPPDETLSVCTREQLSQSVDDYLAAVVAHDTSMAPLAPDARYTENTEEVAVGEGLWQVAGETKLVRSLIDVQDCTTFTEVVLPEDGKDVVIALRLTSANGKITEIEALITRDGDWLFDPRGYINSADQKWDVLPEDQRTSREDLLAAAKAYYDVFNDNSVQVPFGPGCERLEGGQATAPCTAGIPDGVVIGNRRYWADVEAGVSVGMALFGGATSGLLDVHFYRMISGTIRHVHSMTTDARYTTTGWPEGEP